MAPLVAGPDSFPRPLSDPLDSNLKVALPSNPPDPPVPPDPPHDTLVTGFLWLYDFWATLTFPHKFSDPKIVMLLWPLLVPLWYMCGPLLQYAVVHLLRILAKIGELDDLLEFGKLGHEFMISWDVQLLVHGRIVSGPPGCLDVSSIFLDISPGRHDLDCWKSKRPILCSHLVLGKEVSWLDWNSLQ
ncbi:hypothetical protein F2Q68_00027173 [Brassica cretica]|uniref:Uncharacterized protein n=1 Tax=Brassica cretica TaxID=69181 RepID=A0A8S9IHB4_BRACR|nr:hypothetical protein F2Q68_00027173 [Brassica cretica]